MSAPSASYDHVIEAYGEVLSTRAPRPGCVADESELPFSKHVIKAALAAELQTVSDPRLKDLLKTGFVSLAMWQPGIGSVHRGAVVPPPEVAADPVRYANWVVEHGDDFTKWPQVVASEMDVLKHELRERGLW